MGEPKPKDIPIEEQLPILENVTTEQIKLIAELAALHTYYTFVGRAGSEGDIAAGVIAEKIIESKRTFGDIRVAQITMSAAKDVLDGVTSIHAQEYPIENGS